MSRLLMSERRIINNMGESLQQQSIWLLKDKHNKQCQKQLDKSQNKWANEYWWDESINRKGNTLLYVCVGATAVSLCTLRCHHATRVTDSPSVQTGTYAEYFNGLAN